MNFRIDRQSIKQASFLIAIIAVASQGLGVIREALIANYLGTSREYDLLLISMAVPMFLANLFFMSIPSGGIPFLQARIEMSARSSPDGYRDFIKLNNVLILLLSAVVFLALPLFRGILGQGMADRDLDKLILYGRIFCLVIPLKAYEGLFRALLQFRHNFLFPALTIVGFNAGTILVLITLFPALGSPAFIIAWTAGCFLQTLVVAVPSFMLYRKGAEAKVRGDAEPKVSGGFDSSGYLRYLALVALVEGLGLIVEPFDRYLLGSSVAAGYVSANYYAVVVSTVPIKIFVYAVGTAIFPSLSERFADGRREEAAKLYHKSLVVCLTLVPVAVYLLVFSGEIIGILFERGKFGGNSRQMTSDILRYYLAGMMFQALFVIQLRAAYAIKARRFLIQSRLAALLVKILIGLTCIRFNWALAVGGGTAAMFFTNFVIMELLLVRKSGLKYPRQELRRLLMAMLTSGVLSLFLIGSDYAVGAIFPGSDFISLAIVGVCGMGLFVYFDRKFGVYGLLHRAGSPEINRQ